MKKKKTTTITGDSLLLGGVAVCFVLLATALSLAIWGRSTRIEPEPEIVWPTPTPPPEKLASSKTSQRTGKPKKGQDPGPTLPPPAYNTPIAQKSPRPAFPSGEFAPPELKPIDMEAIAQTAFTVEGDLSGLPTPESLPFDVVIDEPTAAPDNTPRPDPVAVELQTVLKPTPRPPTPRPPATARPTRPPRAPTPRPTEEESPKPTAVALEPPADLAEMGKRYYLRGYQFEEEARRRNDPAYYRYAVEAFDRVPAVTERLVYVRAQTKAGRILAYQFEDYAQAVAHFEKALQKDPRHPILHYELGHASFELGRFQEAIGSLDKVSLYLGINPEEVQDHAKLELQAFYLKALAQEALAVQKGSAPLLLRDSVSSWQSFLDSCKVYSNSCDPLLRGQAEARLVEISNLLKASQAANTPHAPE